LFASGERKHTHRNGCVEQFKSHSGFI
jgi:hypothetical protein